MVLGDLHESLRVLIAQFIGSKDGTVTFGPPAAPPSPLKAPVVNLWLADIREEKDGRSSDWQPTVGDDGMVNGWRPPFCKYRLSYVVTVHAASYEAEMNVIGNLLCALGAVSGLPDAVKQGVLAADNDLVRLDLANPEHSTAEGWGLWSSLGVPPRTHMSLTVTAPFRPDYVEESGPPVTHRKLGMEARFGNELRSELIEPVRRDEAVAAKARRGISEG
ncbi:MAG TPA: Pvc16 family protein [Acidimicrobiales bacterium]|nr:Pvc16 family protein [Acidimicrobiales bacterium]